MELGSPTIWSKDLASTNYSSCKIFLANDRKRKRDNEDSPQRKDSPQPKKTKKISDGTRSDGATCTKTDSEAARRGIPVQVPKKKKKAEQRKLQIALEVKEPSCAPHRIFRTWVMEDGEIVQEKDGEDELAFLQQPPPVVAYPPKMVNQLQHLEVLQAEHFDYLNNLQALLRLNQTYQHQLRVQSQPREFLPPHLQNPPSPLPINISPTTCYEDVWGASASWKRVPRYQSAPVLVQSQKCHPHPHPHLANNSPSPSRKFPALPSIPQLLQQSQKLNATSVPSQPPVSPHLPWVKQPGQPIVLPPIPSKGIFFRR